MPIDATHTRGFALAVHRVALFRTMLQQCLSCLLSCLPVLQSAMQLCLTT
jgi:hypothetical protein